MVSFCDSDFWSVHHRAHIVKTYWELEVLGISNQVVGDPFLVPVSESAPLIQAPRPPISNPYTSRPHTPIPDLDVTNPYT